MLLLFLAQAVTPPPAVQPPKPKAIFSRDDYPKEAVRNGWEGTVVADLSVNKKGRVSACRIVKSSGYTVLDRTTCNLLFRRAKFTPATDDNGDPTEDTFRTPPIDWRLQP